MAVIKNQMTGMWEVRTYYKDWTGERKQKTKRGFAKGAGDRIAVSESSIERGKQDA